MTAKRLVAIGASAGGIEALRVIAAALPRDFPAAVCVVVHMSPDSPGILESVLSRVGPLPAVRAATGMRIVSAHLEAHAHGDAARELAERAVETRRQAETVRHVATGRTGLTTEQPQAVGPRS